MSQLSQSPRFFRSFRSLSLLAASITCATLSWIPISFANAWEAVGQFNPAQPVQIKVLNQTRFPIEYGLTDPRPIVSEIPAGETLDINQPRIPNCLALNTPMMSPVQYKVETQGNQIIVAVQIVNDVSGDHCLDLREDGQIFVY